MRTNEKYSTRGGVSLRHDTSVVVSSNSYELAIFCKPCEELDSIAGMKSKWPSATKKAIAAVAIFAIIQLILLFYSFSHPSVDGLVTSSFMLSLIFYPIVWDYHARKMKGSEKECSASPLDSN